LASPASPSTPSIRPRTLHNPYSVPHDVQAPPSAPPPAGKGEVQAEPRWNDILASSPASAAWGAPEGLPLPDTQAPVRARRVRRSHPRASTVGAGGVGGEAAPVMWHPDPAAAPALYRVTSPPNCVLEGGAGGEAAGGWGDVAAAAPAAGTEQPAVGAGGGWREPSPLALPARAPASSGPNDSQWHTGARAGAASRRARVSSDQGAHHDNGDVGMDVEAQWQWQGPSSSPVVPAGDPFLANNPVGARGRTHTDHMDRGAPPSEAGLASVPAPLAQPKPLVAVPSAAEDCVICSYVQVFSILPLFLVVLVPSSSLCLPSSSLFLLLLPLCVFFVAVSHCLAPLQLPSVSACLSALAYHLSVAVCA
jgi:hypothetical protein